MHGSLPSLTFELERYEDDMNVPAAHCRQLVLDAVATDPSGQVSQRALPFVLEN
jgi:hypothetical protein